MFPIKKIQVPGNTLLAGYLQQGTYVDCYCAEVHGTVTFPEFIVAFYTTPLFKVERFILMATVSKPSTDVQAGLLAGGAVETFAAWRVESRRENEILMCDFLGRTRSWLMAVPHGKDDEMRTKLYFGSAVVPKRDEKTGELSLGFLYRALLGFHKIYSVFLLYFAWSNFKGRRW